MRTRRAAAVASTGGERPPLERVAVEPMRHDDLPGVLWIERRCYPRPWSADLFLSELTQEDRCYLVALQPGRRAWRARRVVVGYAGVMIQVGEAHITTVAVHPAHHRQKIATRLLVRLLGEARRRGAEAATLEVRARNHGAQRLYSQFGFAPVGIRPGYYAETGEDAVIMWARELQGEAMHGRLEAQAKRLTVPGGGSGSPDLPVPWVKGRVGLAAFEGDERR